MITKKDLIREIKRQYKFKVKGIEQKEKDKQLRNFKKKLITFNFLGFVENKDLSEEVINYFSFKNEYGVIRGYDWINGNQNLKNLIEEVLV